MVSKHRNEEQFQNISGYSNDFRLWTYRDSTLPPQLTLFCAYAANEGWSWLPPVWKGQKMVSVSEHLLNLKTLLKHT